MQLSAAPNPFPVATGFTVTVVGGIPPFSFVPKPSPPNPPGVTVIAAGVLAYVEVPPGTPPGTVVAVDVSDSSTPPQTGTASSRAR
jgi:hypothetical protein